MSSALLNNFNFKWASTRPSSEYSSVPFDEKSDLSAEDVAQLRNLETRKQRILRLIRKSLLPITTLILFVALCALTTVHLQLRAELAPKPRLHCGTSVESAHAMGCTFDQLNKAWMPAECPRYGASEFVAAGIAAGSNTSDNQWPYYHDRDGKSEITIDGIAHMAAPWKIGEKWWTSGREHMTHCTWMLIRLAYVYSNGLRPDNLVHDFHHAKHCALFMLDRALEGPDVDEIRVIGNTVFGSC